MKPWVGFMKWDIPNPACGEGAPRECAYTHTHSTDASFTYHTVSLTPNQRGHTLSPSCLRSGAGAGVFHQTRHLLRPVFQQHTSWTRLDALTFIPNTSTRLRSQ